MNSPAENAIAALQEFGVHYLNSAKIDHTKKVKLRFKIGATETINVEYLWEDLVHIESKFSRGVRDIDAGVMSTSEANKLMKEIFDYYEYTA